MSTNFTPAILSQSLTWDAYLKLTIEIIETEPKPAIYKDERMLKYTADNLARMKKVLEVINLESKLYNQLNELKEDWTWVCITEPWCGDAAQIVPALHVIASCSERIQFKIILRDSNLEIMDKYLTNGGRSIPKLICLKTETLEEIGTWGPRPAVIQQIVNENKDNPDLSFGEKVRMIHSWYETDKTVSLQKEFIDLIKNWKDVRL